ncbi:MAG TPA: hypothetical protein VLT33_03615, partial [Labilithrix sp.]|nr:hypothetical protein [Labilithrix sp.]
MDRWKVRYRSALFATVIAASCAAPPRTSAVAPGPPVARETSAPAAITPSVAPSPGALETEPPAPVCPPIDEAKLAPPACDGTFITTPVPDVVDARGSLSFFYERLAALARGRATDHVRMAMYGDSNLTMDGITG